MASPRTLRIKVRTDDLLAKIEAHKLKLAAEYEKALAEYKPKVDDWAAKAARCAMDASDRLLDGDLTGTKSSREYVGGNYRQGIFIATSRLGEIPSKPSKPDTDDTITLSADDNLAGYL